MAYTLDYDEMQALINKHYIPVLTYTIFKKAHYILQMLLNKAKTYNERKIVVPLEYANGSNAQPTIPYQTVNLTPISPFTAAEFAPAMVTDSLTVTLEEELVMNSKEAVKNIIDAKMENVKKGLQKHFATNLWARAAVTGDWNPLETVVGIAAFGGIPATGTVPTWWRSKIVDLTSGFTDDPTSESDLIDPSKDVYLKKLLQKGIAKCKAQTGEKPDVISVPQYIWDLIEFILDPQKTGSKMNEKAASMGFDALDYRGIPIVADDDMVVAQTTDNDGRMAFLNLEYLYMFFNSGAKFKVQQFVKPANQNSKSALINCYGNLVCSNRGAQCLIENIHSPRDYAA